MALPLPKDRLRALGEERRRFQRVRVDLLGRYMLPDRREFPCQVVNMSPGGMALVAPVSGQPGERVIAYVDHLGRLEGHVARIFQNGFAMTIAATPRKRDKLAAQLTWLANTGNGVAREDAAMAARYRAMSCGIWKTASRSSSPGCSIRTFSKTPSARVRAQSRSNIFISRGEKIRHQRFEDFEPFDLRHVSAILDDLDPGIRDALRKLVGIDR